MSISNLALVYNALGRHTEALPLDEECLKARRVKLGPEHPDTLTSMNNLAVTFIKLQRHADAVPLLDESLQLLRTKLGPDHPRSIGTTVNLAARLCGHAERMSIVVSEAVRNAAAGDPRLHFHSERQVLIRGLREAVTVYSLTERSGFAQK